MVRNLRKVIRPERRCTTVRGVDWVEKNELSVKRERPIGLVPRRPLVHKWATTRALVFMKV